MSERAQTAARDTVSPARDHGSESLWRLIGRAVAGPLLISATVLIALNGFAFRGLLTSQHPDVLPFWLPTWCYLGKTLASGHIPAWNPAVMGGIPFAADPQSGWLYLTPMLLFSSLSCGAAIRAFIVIQPILSGVGMYWFLRSERTSRPAATVGGLAIALPVAGSVFVVSLPFAGMFAWTPLLLASASRLLRSTTWPGRLIWLTLTALAWGQLTSAHLSNGLVMGTGALVAFLAARFVTDLRRGKRSLGGIGALAGMMVVALPLVNLASLLPRLAYLRGTTLGQGYASLDSLATRLGNYSVDRVLTAGLAPTFPLKLIRSPGLYAGTLALALSFAAFWNRRNRPLAVAFGLYATICYVLSLQAVARGLGPSLGSSSLGGFYTHFPSRMVLGLFLAVPVLSAIGVDAWRESTDRDRLVMVVPAVVVWGLLAPIFGALSRGFVLPLGAALAGTIILVTVAHRPQLLLLVPVVLAADLTTNGLLVERPMFHAALYVRPGLMATYLRARDDGRYLSLAPGIWSQPGYHVLQRGYDWGLMATQRSMLFHLEEAQGYNPVQLLRYWTFVRGIDPKPIRYNAAGFVRANRVVLDLLQVAYVIQPAADPPTVAGQTPVAREGRWVLYRLPDPPPRASVFTSWSLASSASEALNAVLAPAFEPEGQLVLEGGPPPPAPGEPRGQASATFQWEGDQAARIVADVSAPAVLLVRNAYAPHWRATVDGHPAAVLPADYILQGVPLPAGTHTVELSYHDPTIGYGLIGSAVVLTMLIGSAGLLAMRERMRRSEAFVPLIQ